MSSWNAPGGTDPHPDRAYSRSGFAHPDSVDHLAVPVSMVGDDDDSSTCSSTSDSDRDPLRQRRHRHASTWRQRCTRRARRIPPMAAVLLAMAAILLLTAAHLAVSETYETIKYQQRHNDPNTLCSTEHHDDCYPRDFVPTSEYTVIREGQLLPPGLDIRFDWATGERWAKLPAKSADADGDGGVVVVPGTEREEVPLGGRRRGRARPTPAAAARSGPIQADDDLNEPQVLMLAARIVGNIPLTHGEWAALESAAHDIETGTTIVKALHPTLGALAERYVAQTSRKPATVANAHAAIQFFRTVGNALQNNPRAIEALDKKANPPLVPTLVAAIDWHVTAVPGVSDEHAHAAVAQACVHAVGALVRGDEVYVRALVELGGTKKVESWRDLATTAALVRKVEHLLEDLTALVDPEKSESGTDASDKDAEEAKVGSVEDPAVSPSADAGASV
ncbi:hypothetical protein AMAG_02490 [Allomyces macrogynus ATCC 38327]|uniref:Uncharacterized protein n=1 Tax=Allomyces macrogynus (strain ATCC 38327) TaxID=578462 RepID=A0A0L0S2T0_ALLM3|nr:hypothetical protein AMAG_02490 [Allomyces macrogynus ATCC 38327]|eukprot:KNE56710.1 hypothetical protein AMAG_02490 [Allomyces macrogynus ATCC 38327]